MIILIVMYTVREEKVIHSTNVLYVENIVGVHWDNPETECRRLNARIVNKQDGCGNNGLYVQIVVNIQKFNIAVIADM